MFRNVLCARLCVSRYQPLSIGTPAWPARARPIFPTRTIKSELIPARLSRLQYLFGLFHQIARHMKRMTDPKLCPLVMKTREKPSSTELKFNIMAADVRTILVCSHSHLLLYRIYNTTLNYRSSKTIKDHTRHTSEHLQKHQIRDT
jgi:hypothetical protein